MSKTPLTDAKECRRPLYSRGEWDGVPVADYVPSAVSRELETDRAELVEKANLLLTALSASRANPVFANIVDQRADDLAALLARPEADK